MSFTRLAMGLLAQQMLVFVGALLHPFQYGLLLVKRLTYCPLVAVIDARQRLRMVVGVQTIIKQDRFCIGASGYGRVWREERWFGRCFRELSRGGNFGVVLLPSMWYLAHMTPAEYQAFLQSLKQVPIVDEDLSPDEVAELNEHADELRSGRVAGVPHARVQQLLAQAVRKAG